jgi:hypothetical protein
MATVQFYMPRGVADALPILGIAADARGIESTSTTRQYPNTRGQPGSRDPQTHPTHGGSSMVRVLVAASLMTSLAASVAGGQSSVIGSLSGDAYVVLSDGAVRPMASRQVRLVRPGFVGSALRPACRISDSVYFAPSPPGRRLLTTSEILAMASDTTTPANVVALRRELDAATVATASANISGHFSFANVPAGDYYLFSHGFIGEDHVRWLVPVQVAAGRNTTKDLDSSNLEKVNMKDEFCGLINRIRPTPNP